MGSKLSFKGDAAKKKKSKKVKSMAIEEVEEALDGWMPVPSASLAFGPIYITHSSNESTLICIALQPTTAKIYPHPLPIATKSPVPNLSELDLEEIEALESAQLAGRNVTSPTDVHHVFVCTRIQDTQDKITLRSGTGKFLAADEIGIVSCDREARGMQEEWTLIDATDSSTKILIKSAYDKFLSVDTVAGGKLELRADSTEEGDSERWSVTMQGEYLSKAKFAQVERSGAKPDSVASGLVIVGDIAGAENEYISKYQARGQGRLVSSAEDVKDLKRARKEGNLGEAMLERRQKLKSDRYC